MAGEMIREFFVLLGIEADKADFDKVEDRVSKVTDWLKKATVAAAGFGAGLVALSHRFASDAEFIDQWRAKLGASTEELSGLKVAFESVNLEGERGFETISDAAERVGDVVKNVGKLSGDAGEALARLGFKNIGELKDANGDVMQSLPLFKLLVERLKQVENAGQRTGIAMQLFGDQGRDLIPFIERYGHDMDAAIEASMRFGAVVGEDDVKAAREFRAAYAGGMATIRGLTYIVGRESLPVLSKFIRRSSDWVVANRKIIATKIGEYMGKLSRVLDNAWQRTRLYVSAVDDLAQKFGGWENVIIAVAAVLGGLFVVQVGAAAAAIAGAVKAGLALAAAAGLTKTAMIAAAAKAGLFGLALVALGLVIEDLIIYLEGGDSVLGRFLDRFDPSGFDPNEWGPVKALRLFLAYVQTAGGAVGAFWDLLFGNDEEKKVAQDFLNKAGGRILQIQRSLARDVARSLTLNPDGYVSAAIEGVLSGGTGDVYARAKNAIVGGFEDLSRFRLDRTDFAQNALGNLNNLSRDYFRPPPGPVTVGGGGGPTINAPITINTQSNASAEDIGRATEDGMARAIREAAD